MATAPPNVDGDALGVALPDAVPSDPGPSDPGPARRQVPSRCRCPSHTVSTPPATNQARRGPPNRNERRPVRPPSRGGDELPGRDRRRAITTERCGAVSRTDDVRWQRSGRRRSASKEHRRHRWLDGRRADDRGHQLPQRRATRGGAAGPVARGTADGLAHRPGCRARAGTPSLAGRAGRGDVAPGHRAGPSAADRASPSGPHPPWAHPAQRGRHHHGQRGESVPSELLRTGASGAHGGR